MEKRRSQTQPKAVLKKTRADQAVALRRAGYTYREIAEMLGVSRTMVQRYVAEYLRTTPSEDIEEVRRMARDRLEYYLTRIMPAVERGDLAAIDRAIRIVEAIARIHGVLDTPPPVAQQAVVTILWPEELAQARVETALPIPPAPPGDTA